MTSIHKNTIRYSQTWEDSEIVLQALDIQQNDVVFSIASGGENVFAIISKTENDVFAIDYNPLQIFIAELKLIAIKNLDIEQYLKFIGIKKSKNRKQVFNQLSSQLSEECKLYFQNEQKSIKKGIIHIGKFEKYLRIFSKFIIPILISSFTLKKAINSDNKKYQHKNYQKIWNNWRWRLIGELFFGKSVMQKMGRHKIMFKHNDRNNTGKIYLDRAEEFLKNGAIHKNHYLDYILTGNFSENLHYYLQQEKFNNIKKKKNTYFSSTDILSFLKSKPDNSINKYNLSDIFESLNIEETNIIFTEILRTATNNARLIFWNNLVERNIPNKLKSNFVNDIDLQKKLSSLDKVFFYEKFYIYKIVF